MPDPRNWGRLSSRHRSGNKIAIAGRDWVVEGITRQRHQGYCYGVFGRIPVYFGDVAGDIHPKILVRMCAGRHGEQKK